MPKENESPPAEWKPAASADEEKQRFTTFLGEFLEEDDATPRTGKPPVAPPVATAPSGGGNGAMDIDGAINRALDAREGKAKTEERFVTLEKEIAALKTPPKRKWWEPWTLFADK